MAMRLKGTLERRFASEKGVDFCNSTPLRGGCIESWIVERYRSWIPACAEMTEWLAGITEARRATVGGPRYSVRFAPAMYSASVSMLRMNVRQSMTLVVSSSS